MKVPLFFRFLETRAEILKKIVGFLVQTMTSKSIFEINWHLDPEFVFGQILEDPY